MISQPVLASESDHCLVGATYAYDAANQLTGLTYSLGQTTVGDVPPEN